MLRETLKLNSGAKEWFALIIAIILITDIAILLNIPFLRQILGFLFLTLLPGLLILLILKLNKIDFLEKFILTWGLSISFLIFFGLLINNLSLSLGYETPLSTISLLISFNIAFVILAIIGCKIKTFEKSFICKNWLPNRNLSTPEKAFLIVPIMFPALSIFGMNLMNMTDNNIILMIMLFLIPIYIAFVCFFNHKFSKRLYPVVIFLIGISLLLLLSLRSNHLIGWDVHTEYRFFLTTWHNLHWSVRGYSTLDACLSISLLPTIYQSILNVNNEYLYKIFYSMIFSISPLVIYVISKKYVGELYGFLASCFFMFQHNFLWTASSPRTNTAILFFGLAMMTLFSDKIDPLKKRIIFIVFMASCTVSHYSTTYIFFFIILGTFIGIEILSKKYTFKKVVSLTVVLLFFAMLFFWYSQVTETAFNSGVGFIGDTFSNLNRFFIEESSEKSAELFGEGIMEKSAPKRIEIMFSWLTFIFIGIGIITLIKRYKKMSFPELNFEKPYFLKEKFEVGYSLVAFACVGALLVEAALTYILWGYDAKRLYLFVVTILSVFFVIGGITLSKHFFFFIKRKPVLKEKQKSLIKKKALLKKPLLRKKSFTKRSHYLGNNGENASQQTFKKSVNKNTSKTRAYLIILLVLIPYFLCVTGVMYNIFGVPYAIILNSEGKQYDLMYKHDSEVCGNKWLGEHAVGRHRKIYHASTFLDFKKIDGYIFLNYYNVVKGKFSDMHLNIYDLVEYSDRFDGKSKIYNNGGSEAWR